LREKSKKKNPKNKAKKGLKLPLEGDGRSPNNDKRVFQGYGCPL